MDNRHLHLPAAYAVLHPPADPAGFAAAHPRCGVGILALVGAIALVARTAARTGPFLGRGFGAIGRLACYLHPRFFQGALGIAFWIAAEALSRSDPSAHPAPAFIIALGGSALLQGPLMGYLAYRERHIARHTALRRRLDAIDRAALQAHAAALAFDKAPDGYRAQEQRSESSRQADLHARLMRRGDRIRGDLAQLRARAPNLHRILFP